MCYPNSIQGKRLCIGLTFFLGVIFLGLGVLSAFVADDIGLCLTPDVVDRSVSEYECIASTECQCCDFCMDTPDCDEYLGSRVPGNYTCCTDIAGSESAYKMICQTVWGTCYEATVDWTVYVNGYLKHDDRNGTDYIDCKGDQECVGNWFGKWDNGEYKIKVENWLFDERVTVDARRYCAEIYKDGGSSKYGSSSSGLFSLFVFVAVICFIIFSGFYMWARECDDQITKMKKESAKPVVMKDFELVPYDGPNDHCLICQEEMAKGKQVKVCNTRGEVYHKECLDDWMNKQNRSKCPGCTSV